MLLLYGFDRRDKHLDKGLEGSPMQLYALRPHVIETYGANDQLHQLKQGKSSILPVDMGTSIASNAQDGVRGFFCHMPHPFYMWLGHPYLSSSTLGPRAPRQHAKQCPPFLLCSMGPIPGIDPLEMLLRGGSGT